MGPFRSDSLGAILLDIDDPTRVIGQLDEPLLAWREDEREGYVSNILHSCGTVTHGDELILPYGISDMATRSAKVPLDPFVAELTG